MVKGAMVNEMEFYRVCFSNSPVVTQQIKEGSAKLRAAASIGVDALQRELDIFYELLDEKSFGGASVDKKRNSRSLWAATANKVPKMGHQKIHGN